MDEQQQVTPEQAQELIDAMRAATEEVPSYVERDLSQEGN